MTFPPKSSPTAPPRALSKSALVSIFLRVAAIGSLVALIATIEAQRFPDAFRFVSLVSLFLIVAVIASLLRGRAREGAIIVASLALGLSLLEGAAYLIEPQQKVATTDGWSVRRPEIGWGPAHPGRFHSQRTDPGTGTTIYSVDYTIDSNLLRATRSAETRPTIAFFGDSITFGVGLNDEDALPQQFADLLSPRQRVINLAFSGYGPQHFLRELQTGMFDTAIGPEPKLFLFLTSPWHAERTSCKASWVMDAPRYKLENGRLAYKGSCFEGGALQLRQFLWNSALYRGIVDPLRRRTDHAEIEAYIEILVSAVRLAKEKYHVPTLIPYLKASDDYLRGTGFTNETIMEELRRGGAIVVDVSLDKEQTAGAPLAIPGDGHPTALANRLRAELLKNYIGQDMMGVLLTQLN